MKRTLGEIEQALLNACKLALSEVPASGPAHQALTEAIAKAEYDPFDDPEHGIMQHL